MLVVYNTAMGERNIKYYAVYIYYIILYLIEMLCVLNTDQCVLEGNLSEINRFLSKESRRTEIHYSTASPDHKHRNTHASDTSADEDASQRSVEDLLYKVHQSTKSTVVHFDRCRKVIDKLHTDCDVVAKKNGDLMNKLRECDALVKNATPAYVRNELERREEDTQDVGSLVSGVSVSTRSRQNDAEVLTDSVRHNIEAIVKDKHDRQIGDDHTAQVVDNIIKDVKIRRMVLDRCSDAPPRDLTGNKYTVRDQVNDSEHATSKSKMKAVIMDLAEEMQGYVHQETYMTHKQNLGNFQSSPVCGVHHRSFDQIEHDMMHLGKEVRRGDHIRAGTLLKQVSEATKVERQDCLRIVDDIGRVVRMRRLKLQELSTGNRPKRRTMTRRKSTRTLNTNFAKRLSEVERDVRTYMDLEIDLMSKHKEDMMRKRQEYDKELRFRVAEARKLEQRLHEMDNENEKYKKLYAQEKAVKATRMFTRPVIPNHRVLPDIAGNDVTVEISYQRPSPSKSPSRSRQTGRNNITTSRNVAPPHESSLARARGGRQGGVSGSHHARVAAKPRLTPRAKHLTRLKVATARERNATKPIRSSARNV